MSGRAECLMLASIAVRGTAILILPIICCRNVVQKWHGHHSGRWTGLATDSIIFRHQTYYSWGNKSVRMSCKDMEAAWPVLEPWLAKFGDHDSSLGALVTFCSALLIGPACREHLGFQAKLSKVKYLPHMPVSAANAIQPAACMQPAK